MFSKNDRLTLIATAFDALEDAPMVAYGKKKADQQKFRDRWMTWWREKGEKLDVAARLKPPKRRRID